MFPRLLEIPIVDGASADWPVFLVMVGIAVGLAWFGGGLAKKSRLLGKLVTVLPPVALVAAFVAFVETPFGKIPINSYGFMIMVGFLLATYVAVRRGRTLKIDTDLLLDIGIIGMIFGILGAKINFVLQNPDKFGLAEKRSIFDLGDGGLHPLGVLLGALPYLFWFVRTRKEPKVPLFHWKNFVLLGATLLFAVIGTRALYVACNPDEYDFSVYKSWQSGFVLYGGLIGAVAAAMIYIKMRGQSIGRIADLSAPSMMLGLAFGRFGCFLNGCCFGKRCELPWAVSYPRTPIASDPNQPSPAWDHHHAMYDLAHDAEHSFPVHPTQIYEVIVAVGFFFLLSWIWKRTRQRGRGEVFLLMGMLYGFWRFMVEYLRDDPGRDLGWMPLTFSQAVSIAAFALCAVWLLLLMKRPPRSRPDPEAVSREEPPSQASPDLKKDTRKST